MQNLPNWLINFLRTAVQVAWAAALSWLVSHGIPVPDPLVVEVALFAIVSGAVAGGVQWLAGRKGDGAGAKLARGIAAVIMLGLGKSQPIYADPASVVRVDGKVVQS